MLCCIIRGDKSWFHHETPQKLCSIMEWLHKIFPTSQKIKVHLQARKIIENVFSDNEGVVYTEFMLPARSSRDMPNQ